MLWIGKQLYVLCQCFGQLGNFWRDTQGPHNTLKCPTLTGRSLENNVLTEVEAISCFDDAVLSVEIGTHVEKVLSVVQSYPITSADGSQYIPFAVRDTNSSGTLNLGIEAFDFLKWCEGHWQICTACGTGAFHRLAPHWKLRFWSSDTRTDLPWFVHVFPEADLLQSLFYLARWLLRCSSTLDIKVSKFERKKGRTP